MKTVILCDGFRRFQNFRRIFKKHDPRSNVAKKMGEAGRKVVLDQFRWGAIAKQMEEIYQEALL